MLKRWITYFAAVFVGLFAVGALVLALMLVVAWPRLPSVAVLKEFEPRQSMRIFTKDGDLIGEFGVERRTVVKIAQVPLKMKQAILAAEDDRFYEHGGVDYQGVLRALVVDITHGSLRQGGGTITMQVAREFFLTRDKTPTRKINEVLLAYKIEHNLTKNEILELYINQINLGQHAYGFASAAQIYFSKPLEQLNVAEMAMLAGLPKAPSKYNPVVNPKRAIERQHYVLGRMRELNYITAAEYQTYMQTHLDVKMNYGDTLTSTGEFVAEMVRQSLFAQYGEALYTSGIRVYTTVATKDQEAASLALRKGLLDFDVRHGYRGPEKYADLPADNDEGFDDAVDEALQGVSDSDDIRAAVVLTANAQKVVAIRSDGERLTLNGPEALRLASKTFADGVAPNLKLRRGAVIRVMKNANNVWMITQLPQVESAFVALDPHDGAIRALVGGFDFSRNKYNHVTQMYRQPGSSFKPFIYSAALERGFTPNTVVNDAPISEPGGVAGEMWEPQNSDGKFDGPMPMRTGLARSKNMVSIRILKAIGPRYAQDYIAKFGFDPARHPPYLTMALGAGSTTPLEMAKAYAVFANGGYRVEPYLIARIEDSKGRLISTAAPKVAGADAELVIDPHNAYVMTTMLRGVVKNGTAAKAMALGRGDLAGKTGTTNDAVDAWFAGFNSTMVGVAWVGFDQPKSLGDHESGGGVALPIWMGFMSKALAGVPEQPLVEPPLKDAMDGASAPDGAARRTPDDMSASPKPAAKPPSEEVKNQLF